MPVSFLNGSITVNGTNYSGSNGNTVMVDLDNYLCGSNIVVTPSTGSPITYTVGDGEYVLYYANAAGGWDSLLCNKTSKKTDNITRFDYRKYTGERTTYQTNIEGTWNLRTFPMMKEEGEKMFNLLESNYIYLHILKTDEIIPVVVTNSSCDYLNNRNNRRPYQYEIQVTEANLKFRK